MVTSDYISYPPLLLSIRHITTFLIKPRVCKKEKQPWILSLLIFVWTGKQVCLRSCSNSARRRGTLRRQNGPTRHSTQRYFAGDVLRGRNKQLSSLGHGHLRFLWHRAWLYADIFKCRLGLNIQIYKYIAIYRKQTKPAKTYVCFLKSP